MFSRPWDIASTQKLKDLVAKGLSFGCIALEMKMTRNAIIGKAHRIGLKGRKPVVVQPRPKPEKVKKEPVAKRVRAPKKPPLILKSLAANRIAPNIDLIGKADDFTSMGVKISHLEWNDGKPANCRAILRGTGRDAVYCGKDNKHGSSYCEHHTQRFCAGMYQPRSYAFVKLDTISK